MNNQESRPDRSNNTECGREAYALPEAVAEAYGIAVDLIDAGWHLRAFQYRPQTVTATVHAETPSGRVVSISHTEGGNTWGQQIAGNSGAIELARKIVGLGIRDERTGTDYLDQLRLSVQCHAGRPRHTKADWWRNDALPTLPAYAQPSRQARAAAWLVAYLTVERGWTIQCFGEDVASGGYVAAIPGDALVVYPCPSRRYRIGDDGTAATALALMVGRLNTRELALLKHLDYRMLYAAGHGNRAAA